MRSQGGKLLFQLINQKEFTDEYNKMIKAGFDPKINGFRSANPQFYNKIWSPGKILSKIL